MSSNLINSIDDLLTNLDLTINELNQSNNNRHHNNLQIDPTQKKIYVQQPQRVESLPHIFVNSPSEPLIYKPPKDDTFREISGLSDAFGGWIDQYLVLANSTLYIFTSDNYQEKYEDSYTINDTTTIETSTKYPGVIEFKTDIFQASRSERVFLGNIRLEFQCKDEHETNVWFDCFTEAIEEAKKGRKPSIFSPNAFSSSNKRDTSKSNDSAVSFNSPPASPAIKSEKVFAMPKNQRFG
ncbi:hypothetical protein HK099_000142 [Clydaea vesicula]|uniref:PH domain-containing protein n=1 Tax=Clydaea vesicula TaxID=447962 RepID=A0AAD5TVN8_9FUNG|nr:hypothetical protein HK099_000142 [Clydaea vesicula]